MVLLLVILRRTGCRVLPLLILGVLALCAFLVVQLLVNCVSSLAKTVVLQEL
jgi:hypothetical protein